MSSQAQQDFETAAGMPVKDFLARLAAHITDCP